ncbi:condensation domain-containing protein, partial [Tenacibaculum halocynthiae]|uniref:condensation domain-containing protein n=1 Tax=Tenacibaculum halocynthiae TaxID=1254437 RepID=UPI0038B67329
VIEEKLVGIYSEILGVDSDIIGVNSKFFDLGGNSLNLISLKNKIKEVFNVLLNVPELITMNTIKSLAKCINDREQVEFSRILKAEEMDYYPLSSAQKRMYFLYELDKESVTYNLPLVAKLKGTLNEVNLESSFQKLIQRYENLRTIFEFVDDKPVQRVLKEIDFSVTYLNKEIDLNSTIDEFVKPFDLSQGPLFRVGIIKVSSEEHIMIFDCHHIITDGVTNNILLVDFMSIYNEKELIVPQIQYKDYVIWQLNDYQVTIDKQRDYWLNEFSDEVSSLKLPVDNNNLMDVEKEGGRFQFLFDQEKKNKLNSLAKKENTTLFILLFSVYNLLLSKLSNQEDIIIGTSASGRQHVDLNGVTGMLMNVLALRNHPKGDKKFSEFLKEVSEKAFNAFENQDYPLEDLFDELGLKRSSSLHPLFNVMFEYFNFELPNFDSSKLSIEKYDYDCKISKFDMTLRVNELEEGLEFTLEYDKHLFNHSSVERFGDYFSRIIDFVIDDSGVLLKDINVLSSEELEQQLVAFNSTDKDYGVAKSIIDV